MSHPIVTTLTPIAAVTTGIAAAQSLPGAGGLSLTLNGSLVTAGVAVLDVSRRVIITSAGNDSGITFTITGTRGNGWAITAVSETIKGGNAVAAVSTQDFLTVTSIVASAATASTVTAGTNGQMSGPWVVWDRYATDFQISLMGTVTAGTPTWGVEYTYDDCFGVWLPAGTLFPRPLPLGTMTALATTVGVLVDGALSNAGAMASRLTISALGGSTGGGVQLTQQQQGVH